MTHYKGYPNHLIRLKKFKKKNYHLKSESTFPEASQAEWDKPFGFSNVISSFSLKFIKPSVLLSSH